jgi:hypothetical protein
MLTGDSDIINLEDFLLFYVGYSSFFKPLNFPINSFIMHYNSLLILEQLLEIKHTLIYYSPAQTYSVYSAIYLQMIKSFEGLWILVL